MVPLLLETLSFEFEGPWPGVISWLHLVRIRSSMMSKTTHCSAMSPSTLVASSQEAEGRLFPNPILVRATLPSALNVMNASSVGKLVQLVTASRLILYHEGRVDPMKDECHYLSGRRDLLPS